MAAAARFCSLLFELVACISSFFNCDPNGRIYIYNHTMSDDWWNKIATDGERCIFEDDNFFRCFPRSQSHYIDDYVRGQILVYPKFDVTGWNGLQREEFTRRASSRYWDEDKAEGIRWIGSNTNRMEVCCVHSNYWYFACKQDDKFFGVAVMGCHPEVHCNSFTFSNSHGSSAYSIDLADFVDPVKTLEYMLEAATVLATY